MLATLLTSQAGLGAGPLVIVGVVVAYLVANLIDPRAEQAAPEVGSPATASAT